MNHIEILRETKLELEQQIKSLDGSIEYFQRQAGGREVVSKLSDAKEELDRQLASVSDVLGYFEKQRTAKMGKRERLKTVSRSVSKPVSEKDKTVSGSVKDKTVSGSVCEPVSEKDKTVSGSVKDKTVSGSVCEPVSGVSESGSHLPTHRLTGSRPSPAHARSLQAADRPPTMRPSGTPANGVRQGFLSEALEAAMELMPATFTLDDVIDKAGDVKRGSAKVTLRRWRDDGMLIELRKGTSGIIALYKRGRGWKKDKTVSRSASEPVSGKGKTVSGSVSEPVSGSSASESGSHLPAYPLTHSRPQPTGSPAHPPATQHQPTSAFSLRPLAFAKQAILALFEEMPGPLAINVLTNELRKRHPEMLEKDTQVTEFRVRLMDMARDGLIVRMGSGAGLHYSHAFKRPVAEADCDERLKAEC